jgi:hypothetical protein
VQHWPLVANAGRREANGFNDANYYQYGEKSLIGPALSRYFHANNETVSLRWAF